MSSALCSSALFTALAAFSERQEKGSFNVDNSGLPQKFASEREYWNEVSAAIGLDFDNTGYTLRCRKAKGDRGFDVYGPEIANNSDGVACLIWGNSVTPLSDLSQYPYAHNDGKRTYAAFDLNEDEAVSFPLKLAKGEDGKYPEDLAIVKAFNNSKLEKVLSEMVIIPESLSELEPGEYTLTKGVKDSYNGKTTYKVYVEGHGWFKSNTRLNSFIEGDLERLAERPTLTVGEVTEYTSSGYPIVPVTLSYEEDEALEFAYA